MACKWITQETFDSVVQENMVEFEMEPEEALNEAIQQFESQGGETYLSHKTSNKISAVWKYFKISESNPCLAHCKLCSAKLSRGGSKPSSFTTSNLIKHLRLKHKNEHNEFIAVSSCRTQQPTPHQIIARREKLSRDNQRAITINEAVTQFIILDDQPLSIVENVGFRRLLNVLEPKYEIPSGHYVSDVVLPQLYDTVKKHITVMLQEDIKEISFISHIWTSCASPVSVISLTAQWIDDNFTLRKVLLHAKKLQGSHTGQAIASILKEMLHTWTIPRSSVHVVVRDNARNMIKGVDDAGLPSISCVVNMLQLAVSEGLFSQHSVSDAVAVGRKIVGHFNNSNLAYSRLQDIQIQLGQPVKRLQQDVLNRWNSTFYMLQSLIEQKCTIGVYASKYELPVTIAANTWSIMEKLLHLLAPFEELTHQLGSSDAFASDVIPAVTVLQRMLSKVEDEDQGMETMKRTLLAAFQKRFSDTKQNPLYYIATLLDPRYKDRFFSNADTGRQAKLMVLLEMQTLSEETATAEVLEEPAVKRPHSERPSTSLESVFQEIAHESTSESSAPTTATIQLEAYLGEVTLPRSDKPLKYWAVNKLRFPTLAQMAQKYLSAPCSVAESERLFSTASHILTDNRDWLLTENAEIFLFLKKNLPLTFEK